MSDGSLVLELQDMASRPEADIATLLRRAMLVAGKLKLDDFRRWIDLELNGYAEVEVPEYRVIHASLHLRHPSYRSIPLIIEDPKRARELQIIPVRDPIGSLVHLLENPSDSGLEVDIPGPVAAGMMREQPDYLQLPPFRCVSPNSLATIVDTVRTKILDWSLKLESEGILGEGMQFSKEERDIAATTQSIHIHSFQGILGNVTDESQVSQNFSVHVTTGDFNSLSSELIKLGVSAEEIEVLQQAMEKDGRPDNPNRLGPETSGWIGRMVSKAANGGLHIGVGAAGNLLAKAILMYYGFA